MTTAVEMSSQVRSESATEAARAGTVDMKLEVVVIPVFGRRSFQALQIDLLADAVGARLDLR